MRIFVSVLLPPEIITELIRVQKELRAYDAFEGNFVRPENMHITLHFFGSVDDNLLPVIGAQLVAVTQQSFEVHLKALEVNSRSKPHVLWVSVVSPELEALALRIQQAFPAFKEERAFTGHITLARMKKVTKDRFRTALAEIQVKPLSWVVNEYALQVSDTTPEGPLYTTLGIYTLEKIE